MEKYAEIIEAMRECAGPDCGVTCPYKDKSFGGKSCRALLLENAAAALTSETMQGESYREKIERLRSQAAEAKGQLQDAKEALDTANAEYEAERERYGELFAHNKALEEDARSVRAHRDAIIEDRAKITVERDNLRIRLANLTEMRDKLVADKVELCKECDMLHERCQVQQNEINALLLKMGKQDGKTDRPSVGLEELAEKIGEMVALAKYQEGRADALAAIVERCSFGGGGRHE